MTSKDFTTKNCYNCGDTKQTSEFNKNRSKKDGLSTECRRCSKIKLLAYSLTMKGLASKLYGHQRSSSKYRGHPQPVYTRAEFGLWLFSQPNFNSLYNDWASSGYIKKLRPSCDRLDDYKPYTINNLQLITWAENKQKGHDDRRNGVNNKWSKSVLQLTKSGLLINKYHSGRHAGRETGIAQQSISMCCNGELKSAGGFKWSFLPK